MQVGMPGTTITQAIKFLEKKDYVIKNKEGYYSVLDPILRNPNPLACLT